MKKAVVLLSGGLDSTTVLYWAKKRRYQIFPLAFDYGQRHGKKELRAARKIARLNELNLKVIQITLPWKGSSLLDTNSPLPQAPSEKEVGNSIPSTYVPGRNLIFLAFALSYAEAVNASLILIGANSVDFSGYPDCRPQFYRLLNRLALIGTKTGCEGQRIQVVTPLIYLSKANIIRLGKKLKVPYRFTWSCYAGKKKPCGKCDSCLLRSRGFAEAGIKDPCASRK
jgi:7-cyano-7-deazaguanine synthase